MEGTALLDIERVDPRAEELTLDAVAFEVRRVEVDGKVVAHVYDGSRIRLPVAKGTHKARVSVAYRATPRKGMYFLAPDEHVRDRPRQVWTQCQEEDGRHWFPCIDKPHVKMTTEIAVVVPKGWTALSNGDLVASEPDGPAPRFHFRMNEPHASYLLTLVAGEFTVLEDDAAGVPLTYLVPPGREEDGRRTFARTAAMVKHFSKVTGVPYPWSRYAQVVVSDFIFGGMENTTATTMYEHILLDPRAALDVTSDDLIAHELAHQWFGDYVTCRDWSEGWLNEGFATYFEHVWREHHLGRDEYDYGVKTDLEAYVGEAHGRYRRPVVCQDYEAPLDLFDRHLYEKGGLVLHLLRRELGDEVFWRGVNVYLSRHGKGVVETRDLQRALEEVSGRSLGRFFEQWVWRPGHPELEITVAWADGLLTVEVKQSQSDHGGVPSVFHLPLVLELGAAQGALRRQELTITQKTEVFAFQCAERPAFVVVDPDMRIVGEVKLKAPADMLRAQLAGAPTARGRWLAAEGLARMDDPVTLKALGTGLRDEQEAWMVRVECAQALGRTRTREAEATLVEALGEKHPKVRRAVVAALGAFRTPAAAEALRPRALEDASYLVEAEAARALGKTRQPLAFDTLVDVLDRPSWADVVRAAAADGLAALRDERALPHLLARTRYGHPERARRAAIAALPKLSGDRKTREALEDLLDDESPHVRIDVVRALLDMGDGRARGALRTRLEVDLDARVRRRIREVLRDLGDGRSATRELRDELDRMQGEVAELRARFARLEAKADGPGPKNTASTAEGAVKAKVPGQAKGPRRGKPKRKKA